MIGEREKLLHLEETIRDEVRSFRQALDLHIRRHLSDMHSCIQLVPVVKGKQVELQVKEW